MSRDLTIDSVLADPMIQAVMRADHVEPKVFERLLRSAADDIGREGPERPPYGLAGAALVARQARVALRSFCCP